MPNIVAIVGRPNVGKSTLFNRLTKTRSAIVDELSGVTRDRNYGISEWNGKEFSVIDTGGYVEVTDDIFEKEIKKQVLLAINEADVILFLVDVISGITPYDEYIAEMLRRSKKNVLLVVNKVDNYERSYDASEFYKFGFKKLFQISSINGSGTGDLLDEVVSNFEESTLDEAIALPKIAIVGRPNVGKSTLINTLLGEDRFIVTPIAGTTRDSIDTRYNKFGFNLILIDTAGIRKKSKVKEDVEFYSVMRSIRTIERSDVCMLMLDATSGIEAQDINILGLIHKNHKGLVILVNKWDLYEKDNKIVKEYTDLIKSRIAPFNDVPIIFISALNKQRINKALEEAMHVYNNRMQRINTSKLNEIMLETIENYPPPAIKGKYIKIKYVTQLPLHYPAFAFFCNLPQYIKEPYKRFVENKLRESFDFTGVPIEIFFRKK